MAIRERWPCVFFLAGGGGGGAGYGWRRSAGGIATPPGGIGGEKSVNVGKAGKNGSVSGGGGGVNACLCDCVSAVFCWFLCQVVEAVEIALEVEVVLDQKCLARIQATRRTFSWGVVLPVEVCVRDHTWGDTCCRLFPVRRRRWRRFAVVGFLRHVFVEIQEVSVHISVQLVAEVVSNSEREDNLEQTGALKELKMQRTGPQAQMEVQEVVFL